MKKVILSAIMGLTIIILTGCASVKFYSNSGLTQSTGLKYYTVKPFLLVERDPINNNIVNAMVLYLPDIENPQYMVIKDGLGAKKVDMNLTDGSINTFGLSTDPKIAESIEALTSLISKGASAITDLSTLKGTPPATVPSAITELYEIFMSNGVTTVRKIEIK